MYQVLDVIKLLLRWLEAEAEVGCNSAGTTDGTNGGSTTFGSFLTANGGYGAIHGNNGVSGNGGTVSVSSPAVTISAFTGSSGQGGLAVSGSEAFAIQSSMGGASPLGGVVASGASVGYGCGGSGSTAAGVGNIWNGGGGGAGGYIKAYIINPTTQSIVIGAGGTSAQAFSGAPGVVVVTEYINTATGSGSTTAITASSLNGGQFAGIRNRIINGDMSVSQVNGTSSKAITAGAGLSYVLDQWAISCTGANVTAQQVAGSGVDQYALQITGAASVTGISVAQPIESYDIYDLAGKTVTLSAKLSNSLLTSVTWTALYPSVSDNFTSKTSIATGTFTVTSTPTVYSTQIVLPSNCTKGLEIMFSVGAQISGTWTITEVQVESGSTATPFERIHTVQRYLLALRFFEVLDVAVAGTTNNGQSSDSTWPFQVRKRVTPTIVAFSGSNGNVYGIGLGFTQINTQSGTPQYNAGSTANAQIIP